MIKMRILPTTVEWDWLKSDPFCEDLANSHLLTSRGICPTNWTKLNLDGVFPSIKPYLFPDSQAKLHAPFSFKLLGRSSNSCIVLQPGKGSGKRSNFVSVVEGSHNMWWLWMCKDNERKYASLLIYYFLCVQSKAEITHGTYSFSKYSFDNYTSQGLMVTCFSIVT